jgi:TM2 domain-containing membrane protein YozV
MRKSIKFLSLAALIAGASACSTGVKIAKEDWQARNDVRNRTELAQFNQRTLPTENTVVASSEVVASTEIMPTITAPAFTATAEQVKTANRVAEIVANSEGKTEKQIKKEVKQALKAYKAAAKADRVNEGTATQGEKSQLIAAMLAFFFGGLGIHRFYLGYTWQGIVQLLTAGVCGIWSLIDFIRILMGTLKPKGGDYDKNL